MGLLPTYDKFRMYTLDFTCMDIININNRFKPFCALHLGREPEEAADTKALEERDDVKSMPCYPDSGFVKVIDGIVVVKLS